MAKHNKETSTFPYINRDLSWLSFNYRVLQEAKDPSVLQSPCRLYQKANSPRQEHKEGN